MDSLLDDDEPLFSRLGPMQVNKYRLGILKSVEAVIQSLQELMQIQLISAIIAGSCNFAKLTRHSALNSLQEIAIMNGRTCNIAKLLQMHEMAKSTD